ncbi:MAG: potassium-transporting ATPase subunit KdpC [bacterium]
MKNIKACVFIFLLLTAITGALYPAAVTAVAQLLFADKANGSLIRRGDEIRGSRLIGQKFTSPAYFAGRPSASDYSALPSAASNQGPTSASLKSAVEGRRRNLTSRISGTIPADLLLASGSGLDPHISPEAALVQIDHVAKARNLSGMRRTQLERLVRRSIEGPQMGIFGAPRVNALKLNMETDHIFGAPRINGDELR